MSRFALVLGIVSLVATAPPAAAGPRPEDVAVRVSLSADDPHLQSDHRTLEPGGFVEFFVFLDGMETIGGELGLTVEGGEFIAYVIDTSKPWLAMPHVNPYPGTISQVRAGPNCYEPPVYLGRILVRPDTPDGRVNVRVITSELQHHAVMMGCIENEPVNGFRAYPAAFNGEADESYMVHGEEIEGIRRNLDPTGPKFEEELAGPESESESETR